jgi:hypothetical protein
LDGDEEIMKKIIVILIIIVIGTGAYFVSSKYFKKDITNTPLKLVEMNQGNSTGNIANAGYVTRYKDSLYGDINKMGQGLYKSDLKLKNQVKVNEDQALYVNADADWIYYVNYSDNNRLYKISTDGKDVKKLTDDGIDSLNLENGWLYYIDASQKGIICKLSIDGKSKFTLSKDTYCSNLLVKNGWVYYTYKGYIYRLDTNGANKLKIAEIRITPYVLTENWRGNFDVDDNYIYYPGKDGCMYKIKLNGTENTKITAGNVESINIYSNYVYYFSYTSQTIYRIKLGEKPKLEYIIGGGSYYNIIIVSNNGVMFKDKADENGGLLMVLKDLSVPKK